MGQGQSSPDLSKPSSRRPSSALSFSKRRASQPNTLRKADANRRLAEEILSGFSSSCGLVERRPSDLVVRNKAEGEKEELEGLMIKVGEGKRLSRRLDPPLVPRNGTMKRPSLNATSSNRRVYSSHVPLHSPLHSPAGTSRSLSYRLQKENQPAASPAHPASRWSPSTTGEASPAFVGNSFRNSFIGSVAGNRNSHRFSYTQSNRLSAAHPATVSSPQSVRSAKFGFRLGVPKQKAAMSIKKRGITVVGAQRVGSGRYSVMKETAARAAATRQENNVVVAVAGVNEDGKLVVSDRRPSVAAALATRKEGETVVVINVQPPARRGSSAFKGSERRRSSTSDGRRGSAASNKASGRKGSAVGRTGEAKKARGGVRRPVGALDTKDDADESWIDVATPPTSSAKVFVTPSSPAHHTRTPSVEALTTFVAASPLLTCADVGEKLFETQGRKLSCVPVPILANRLPTGHPANHHHRFKSLSEQGAVADASLTTTALSTKSLPAPPGPATSSRRGSNTASAASLPITSSSQVRGEQPKRKLSAMRLSNAADKEQAVTLTASAAQAKVETKRAVISFGDYSLSSPSNESRGAPSVCEIAPEDLEASPTPPFDSSPSFLRPQQPPAPRPVSLPESQISSGSGDSLSSLGSEDAKVRLVIGHGARFSADGRMERISSVVQINLNQGESTFKRFGSGSAPIAEVEPGSPATFTMDDLMTSYASDQIAEPESAFWTATSVAPLSSASLSGPPPYSGFSSGSDGASTKATSTVFHTESTLFPTPEPKQLESKTVFVPDSVSPLFQPPQPLPSAAHPKHTLRLDFKDFKLAPGDAEPARKLSLVSPMSQPLMSGFSYIPMHDYLDPSEVPMPVIYTPSDIRSSFLGGADIDVIRDSASQGGGAETRISMLEGFDFNITSPDAPIFAATPDIPMYTGPVTPVHERMGSEYFTPEATKKRENWIPSFDPVPIAENVQTTPRRETYSCEVPQPASPFDVTHRWERAHTFDAGAGETKGEKAQRALRRKEKQRQPSLVGPDAPARLGDSGKRGFSKGEIRGWLLDARRESVAMSGGA